SGIELSLNSVMLGTTLGLVLGKPLGIIIFCFLGEKLNLATRPKDLNYTHILSVGFMSGIGFTMSIFVANLAYKDDILSIDMSKISILIASSIAAILGLLAVYLSTRNQDEQSKSINEENEQQKIQDEIQKLKNTQSVI
ncbi:Na+/H+ antiporter NhaA, partial [Helicobacter japonicus]